MREIDTFDVKLVLEVTCKCYFNNDDVVWDRKGVVARALNGKNMCSKKFQDVGFENFRVLSGGTMWFEYVFDDAL